MTLSYRTRKALMNLATTTLILILVAAVLWLCWIVWVGRYMVYHRDGPRLDFSVSPVIPEGIEAQWTSPSHSVKVYYNEPEIQLPVVDKEPTRISGYYIDVEALKSDVEPLIAKLELLERNDEETLESINDLSEDVRHEIDNIYMAIAALSVKPADESDKPVKKIGFK